MKSIIIAFALIGCAAAALPDSATQGPNPQDIATPEPEYIDVDEPPPAAHLPAPAPARAPVFASAPIQSRSSFSVPQYHAPQPVPVAAPSYARTISQSYLPPSSGGHFYNPQNGYQYKQVRRFIYRRRY